MRPDHVPDHTRDGGGGHNAAGVPGPARLKGRSMRVLQERGGALVCRECVLEIVCAWKVEATVNLTTFRMLFVAARRFVAARLHRSRLEPS